jgi:hypothetical protein
VTPSGFKVAVIGFRPVSVLLEVARSIEAAA